MTEFIGKSPELDRSAERIKQLTERLDTIAHRSSRIGVDLAYLVTDQNLRPITSKDEDRPIFAASVGKLPLAIMALDQLDYDAQVEDDLDKMLAFSDNAAYSRLAEKLGGPHEIDSFYNAWRQTSVYVSPENGKAEIGETTPAEAIWQLRALLGTQPNVDFRLGAAANDALMRNQVYNHGVRRVLKEDHPDIVVWNKTGEYNGDQGAQYAVSTPYSVRHDVGAINTLGGQNFLFYAFMARGHEGKAGGMLGDQVVSLATAEVLVAMGHYDYLKFGAKAMRFAGVKPPLPRRAIA